MKQLAQDQYDMTQHEYFLDVEAGLSKMLGSYKTIIATFSDMEPLLSSYRLDRAGHIKMPNKDISERLKELDYIINNLRRIEYVEPLFPGMGCGQAYNGALNVANEWRYAYLESVACNCGFNSSDSEFNNYKKVILNVLVLEECINPHIEARQVQTNAAIDSIVKKQQDFIKRKGLDEYAK